MGKSYRLFYFGVNRWERIGVNVKRLSKKEIGEIVTGFL
jgi:hypothetical protein